jgi:hypothetical protein
MGMMTVVVAVLIVAAVMRSIAMIGGVRSVLEPAYDINRASSRVEQPGIEHFRRIDYSASDTALSRDGIDGGEPPLEPCQYLVRDKVRLGHKQPVRDRDLP